MQMSAKASNASFASLPQNFAIVCAAFFWLHTAFTSLGSLYELTAPRRQPGGDAETKDAKANNVAVKRVLACIVDVVWWYFGCVGRDGIDNKYVYRLTRVGM
jgi:hypothetical protein